MKIILLIFIAFSQTAAYDIFNLQTTAEYKRWSIFNNKNKLLVAILNNDIIQLEKLHRKKVKINKLFKRKEKTFTALAFAIYHNRPELVEFLISIGAHVNQPYTGSHQNHLSEAVAIADTHLDLRIPIILLSAGAQRNPTNIYHPVILAIYRYNVHLVDLLLAFGLHTNQELLDLLPHANGLIARDSYEKEVKNEIIESLQCYRQLQPHVLNPTSQSFVTIIESGFLGLTKQSIENGIQPKLENLNLVKERYSLLKSVIKDYQSEDSDICPFCYLKDKEIYTQVYREIGKKLIEYLRFYEKVGCKTYPAISKTGIKSLFNNQIPVDIVKYIAWLTVN